MSLTKRRLEALLDGLGDLSGSDEEEIDSRLRDEIGHVRAAIYDILDRRAEATA